MNATYQNTQIALAICIMTQCPVILWGSPGVGKTAVLNALAKHYNMEMSTVILSQREPSDLLGLPYIDKGEMQMSLPDFANVLFDAHQNGRGSILFLDEYSTAPPSMQAASLRLTAERMVGRGVRLPDSTVIVAAANPPSIASAGSAITPPAANRFVHLPWDMPLDVLVGGLTLGWDPLQFPMIPPNFETVVDQVKQLIAAFLSSRGDNSFVSTDLESLESLGSHGSHFSPSDLAYPSPRMWVDYVAPVVAMSMFGSVNGKKIPTGVLKLLLEGTVGRGVGGEFLNFILHMDLPDPIPVLKGQSKWAASKDIRSDILSVVSYSFVNAYKTMPGKDAWIRCGDVLSTVATVRGDIALMPIKMWLKERPVGVMPSQTTVDILTPLVEEISKLK